MLKKITVVIFAAGLLAGCGLWTPEMTLSEKVTAVQDKAVELCAYLPTVNSVSAMLATANPAFISVSAVAGAICSAVTAWKPPASGVQTFVTQCPRVNGVCVEGEFVDPKKGK